MGGEDEAAYYLAEYGFAWRDTPGAIPWLVETTGNLKPKQGRAGKLHLTQQAVAQLHCDHRSASTFVVMSGSHRAREKQVRLA